MNQKFKTYAMPVAMVIGILFHRWVGELKFLSPWLIAAMLFVTFTRVKVKELRLRKIHAGLLAFQLVVSAALYLLLMSLGVSEVISQGVMMCVFMPTAMASVVIGAMLGANVGTMTTFTLLSNMAVSVTAPVLFSFVGTNTDLPFLTSFWMVLRRLLLLVVTPFALAALMERFATKAYDYVHRHQQWSFYLWVVALIILMGSTTNFILAQPKEAILTEVVLAIAAGVICITQFRLGRVWGRKCGDKVSGGQSLGQKNTLLAILLAQSYLNPLSSIAPAAYIVWQNIFNSWQLSRYKENKE